MLGIHWLLIVDHLHQDHFREPESCEKLVNEKETSLGISQRCLAAGRWWARWDPRSVWRLHSGCGGGTLGEVVWCWVERGERNSVLGSWGRGGQRPEGNTQTRTTGCVCVCVCARVRVRVRVMACCGSMWDFNGCKPKHNFGRWEWWF